MTLSLNEKYKEVASIWCVWFFIVIILQLEEVVLRSSIKGLPLSPLSSDSCMFVFAGETPERKNHQQIWRNQCIEMFRSGKILNWSNILSKMLYEMLNKCWRNADWKFISFVRGIQHVLSNIQVQSFFHSMASATLWEESA